jgi:hypothetical protein
MTELLSATRLAAQTSLPSARWRCPPRLARQDVFQQVPCWAMHSLAITSHLRSHRLRGPEEPGRLVVRPSEPPPMRVSPTSAIEVSSKLMKVAIVTARTIIHGLAAGLEVSGCCEVAAWLAMSSLDVHPHGLPRNAVRLWMHCSRIDAVHCTFGRHALALSSCPRRLNQMCP